MGTGTFTIRNDGETPLTVSSVTLGGIGDFLITGGIPVGPFPLAPGADVTGTVEFDPLLGGPQADTITITSNDPDEGTVVLALTGTGGGGIVSAASRARRRDKQGLLL